MSSEEYNALVIGWMQAVYQADHGRSVVSGEPVPFAIGAMHHVIPKYKLRERGLDGLVWGDPRNGVLVTIEEHSNHEAAGRRIPRACLPARTLEFVSELGDWADAYLDQTYPVPRRSE
jgi:hypothetical protein